MMEEQNNIDKIFHDTLNRHEEEPSEKVWTSIASELDKKKKSRGFGLFWIVLLAGLISFGTYEYINMDQDSGTSINIKRDKETAGTQSPLPENNNGSLADSATENTSGSRANIISDKNTTADEHPAHVGSSQPAQRTDRLADSKPVPAKAASTKAIAVVNEPATKEKKPGSIVTAATVTTLSSPRGLRHHDDDTNPTVQNRENPSTGEKIKGQDLSLEKNLSGQESVPLNQKEPATQESAVTAANSTSVNTDFKDSNVEKEKEIAPAEKVTPPAPDSAGLSPSVEKNADLQPAATKGLKALLKKIGSHSSIALFYSPDYSASRTTGDNEASSEKAGYSWSSGLKLGYDLSKRFSISAGANYSFYSKSETFSTVFVTSDDEYREEHEGDHDHGYEHGHGHGGGGHHDDDDDDDGPGDDGNHYVVHTSCGDIDLSDLPPQTTGDEESGETLSLTSNVVSSVEFINIPLKLRFNFLSRKLVYYVEAGASMGFIVNSNAKISIGSYSENSVVKGLTNHQYSALLNLGVEYRFFRGIGLFLEPNLRYSITPINDSGSSRSYPYFIGGNAGLSIHF